MHALRTSAREVAISEYAPLVNTPVETLAIRVRNGKHLVCVPLRGGRRTLVASPLVTKGKLAQPSLALDNQKLLEFFAASGSADPKSLLH